MTLFSGLGALIPTSAVDVVAIFSAEELEGPPEETTFLDTVTEFFTGEQEGQLVPGARPMKAVINESAEFFKHPLENSKKITDHRIILPVDIEISMIITGEEYPDVYKEIKQLFLDGTELVIQTRTDSYTGQVIQSMPHEETPEVYDGILLSFGTSEIQTAPVEVEFSPSDETQESTVDRGEQLPTEASAGKSSAAADLFDKAVGFF